MKQYTGNIKESKLSLKQKYILGIHISLASAIVVICVSPGLSALDIARLANY